MLFVDFTAKMQNTEKHVHFPPVVRSHTTIYSSYAQNQPQLISVGFQDKYSNRLYCDTELPDKIQFMSFVTQKNSELSQVTHAARAHHIRVTFTSNEKACNTLQNIIIWPQNSAPY